MDVLQQRLIIAAQGYSELGLHDDALEQLAALPKRLQKNSLVRETRLAILMQAKRYSEALPIGEAICRDEPDKPMGYIHAAFCLHELGKTGQARELLLTGPTILKTEPTYHYNLACYEAVLGNMQQAKMHLKISFGMDARFREYAIDDPDLHSLREELKNREE